GKVLREEVRCDPKGAGAARSLCRHEAILTVGCQLDAKREFPGEPGIGGAPRDGKVALRLSPASEALLRFMNRGKERGDALLIDKHANAEIDFSGARISFERVGETENRIGWSGDNGVEKSHQDYLVVCDEIKRAEARARFI